MKAWGLLASLPKCINCRIQSLFSCFLQVYRSGHMRSRGTLSLCVFASDSLFFLPCLKCLLFCPYWGCSKAPLCRWISCQPAWRLSWYPPRALPGHRGVSLSGNWEQLMSMRSDAAHREIDLSILTLVKTDPFLLILQANAFSLFCRAFVAQVQTRWLHSSVQSSWFPCLPCFPPGNIVTF